MTALLPAMQSKITELEEKNAEIMAELKRLQQENQNLDSRMGALVRLLHQRNAQLDQARSQGVSASVAPGAAAKIAELRITFEHPASSHTGSQPVLQQKGWWKHFCVIMDWERNLDAGGVL